MTSRVEVTNRQEGTVEWIDTRKLFVCIGGKPDTEWAKDTEIVRDRYIVTGADLLDQGRPPECWKLKRIPYYLETTVPGSFAADDVRHRGEPLRLGCGRRCKWQ